MFDGCKMAAYMLPDGRILTANDFDSAKGIAALADATGTDPRAWEED